MSESVSRDFDILDEPAVTDLTIASCASEVDLETDEAATDELAAETALERTDDELPLCRVLNNPLAD
ncbi:MAG: hypothetical protein HC886_00760 [Leptolyngbyaceae cyanobacterium SM1_1_3]|nr:hypothetical protein [Leptolyngbyaceae cyanobacterium SM1_1_3]